MPGPARLHGTTARPQYFYDGPPRGWGGLISEAGGRPARALSTPQTWMENHMLLDSVFEAFCPYLEDMLRLAPALQAKADAIKEQLSSPAPVVSLHARGGDKGLELER